MNGITKFRVRKRTLLEIAGIVWIIAGINVSRMGILGYLSTNNISITNIFLSIVVFGIFGTLFYKMSLKHLKRIKLYEEDTRYFWDFFDLKAYIVMIFMMSGSILLRSLGLVSLNFIAVFYTGLGLALIMAGSIFEYMYCKYQETKK